MEDVSFESPEVVDFERVLYQALVNEGKHTKVLGAIRQNFTYNEKQLRDAAAAEVAKLTGQTDDMEGEKSSRKRKQMTAEEKSKQNRDRNREHAKNTRLRKKAYVTKLKELVDQLSHQRSVEAKEKVFLGKRIHDTQVLRKNAVRLFLSYRAASVQDYSKWAAIVDENIVVVIPMTPYRAFNRREVVSSERVINGIGGLIADVASVALVVESIGQGTAAWVRAIRRGQSCRVWYDVGGRNDIMGAGEVVICKFVERSEGHIGVGAPSGFTVSGMLQCRFNKANKIVSAEIVFDVMSCMQQLQRATLSSAESILHVPNSLEAGMQPTSDARMIATAAPPHRVVFVNQAWARLFSDGDKDALYDDSWFNDREAASCMVLPASSDECPIDQKLRAVLAQAGTGIPSRIAFSRSCRDGGLALCYAKVVPLSREDGEADNYILVILHEYEAAKCTSPRESGVIYGTTSGRVRPSSSTAQSWEVMSMHSPNDSAQGMVGGQGPATSEAKYIGAVNEGFVTWEQQSAAGGAMLPMSCFQRAPHLTASAPPAWLTQQTIMKEEAFDSSLRWGPDASS